MTKYFCKECNKEVSQPYEVEWPKGDVPMAMIIFTIQRPWITKIKCLAHTYIEHIGGRLNTITTLKECGPVVEEEQSEPIKDHNLIINRRSLRNTNNYK